MGYFIADCPRCGTKQITLDALDAHQVQGGNYEVFCACRECGDASIFLSFFQRDRQGAKFLNEIAENIATRGWQIIEPVVLGLTDVEVPEGTPDDVAAPFVQGRQCLKLGLADAAAAMFRKALDLATKERWANAFPKDPPPALMGRLDKLAAEGFIPNRIATFGHRVRIDGNSAVHDAGPFTAEEAEDLDILTTEFLRQTYEADARLTRMEARRPDPRGAAP